MLKCTFIKAGFAFFFFFFFWCKGVTGGVMLLINLVALVRHVPLALEEVAEKICVTEVCTISIVQVLMGREM